MVPARAIFWGGKMMRIRIHPPGERITDPALAEFLSMRAPTAFRKAQDVLVAAQKYVAGSGGWFSSERSRRNALERELTELGNALARDRWNAHGAMLEGDDSKTGRVVDFLCQFSDAFPNWQREYSTINRILGR
jgi:hypothetical protein